MTDDRPQRPEDHPPYASGPAPDVTSDRWADRWEGDAWRAPLAGVVLGLLTLPAVAMVLVGLLVLAVQGAATWLVVTAVALVTTLVGALGTVVALRRGHPGVVHRLAVVAWVWGVVVTVLGVVLALSLDVPERVAVAVLLVLGGTYTVVLGLGLWGAARLLPAPVERTDATAPVDRSAGPADATARGPVTATGATPTVSEVPTQATAPDDDDALADWPEWGANDPARGAAGQRAVPSAATTPAAPTPAAPTPPPAPEPAPQAEPEPARPAGTEDVVDAEVVEPAPTAPMRTAPAPRRDSARTTGGVPPRASAGAVQPAPSADSGLPPASRPPRRSVTSSGTARVRRTPQAGGPATERIARQDGDDGPPTQRLPPVGR
ncbi:hypothetical protein [Cellulomonas sp. S1-8]|uniref:hypothetical protein n=1 Tax=Cellulomonas sp. S1-8 TaxID=2904790 RepID=UPI00224344AC|nr:hypothetical protein [Cellulomonas sp. S1-8]UZN02861.1 hypothetical protein OKX07_17685 [Cellulomonas sp. S1-8]